MYQPTRRSVLLTTAAAFAMPSFAQQSPGDKIVVGVMGTAGRGTSVAQGFATQKNCAVKYVCDVDAAHAAGAAKAVQGKQQDKVDVVSDFRRILDDKDVHALVVAAPDHWHAPATIAACAAGKHVYCEKPCSHNPAEGEMAIAAARKHNRVVQHGTQRRSWNKVVEAVQLVKDGKIGNVRFSRGWYTNARTGIGRGKAAPVPAGLDWSLWQGPAPEREFRDNYLHYKWHWFWHWGTGEAGNNGVHSIDICRWGLGVDYPKRVTAGGGRYYFEDDQETPDTHVATFDFGDKFITWEGRSCAPTGSEGSGFGIAFYGDSGGVIIDGNGYRLLDTKGKEVDKQTASAPDAPHFENFLTAIRENKRPVADIEEGHKSTLLCHLANIAYRTNSTINCDPKNGHIVGHAEAEKLWGREYRAGWEPTF
jgi:predicted dehydrogenase